MIDQFLPHFTPGRFLIYLLRMCANLFELGYVRDFESVKRPFRFSYSYKWLNLWIDSLKDFNHKQLSWKTQIWPQMTFIVHWTSEWHGRFSDCSHASSVLCSETIALTRKRLASSAWPHSRPSKDGPLCLPVRTKILQVCTLDQMYFHGYIFTSTCYIPTLIPDYWYGKDSSSLIFYNTNASYFIKSWYSIEY